MKLSIERTTLLKALEPAARVVERVTTIAVLANVRLAAADGALVITATDLDIELRSRAACEVAEAGALTVSAVRLHDIVRKLPESGKIDLEATSSSSITLRCGRSRFQLNTLPESDFPDITAGEMSHRFSMPAKTLASLIATTQFAICTDATRPFLAGIHLHETAGDSAHDGARLTAVATDGHRLARIHTDAPHGSAGMPGIIVPRKAVAEIARLIDKCKDDIAIALSDKKIQLEVEGYVFTSKLIEGTYPAYQRVIPVDNDKHAIVDAKELAGAAERVATISGERGRAVKLDLGTNKMVLTVTNPDSGTAREELDCDYDGAPIEIGFNARYLGDILAMLGGDTVLMKLADPGAPTILQTREGSDVLTVLMPMRV